MTTKPKAKKFRIRRTTGATVPPVERDETQPAARSGARVLNAMEQLALDGTEDGFPAEGFATAGRGAVAGAGRVPVRDGAVESPAEVAADQEIAAIRREGLTGRQLRMARRVAQKHGLPATSDFDAVRLLRRAGIDPFLQANMLELVSADGRPPQAREDQVKLPQTVPNKQSLPSTRVMDIAERAKSVIEIQRDIARRRRRKLALLFTRLAFFVLLPTLMAGYYYYQIATPMYATKSEFVIQKADGGGASGLGSLFAGSGLATSQDSITVQSYLTSRDALLRLDSELGFKAHFQAPEIDPIQRLTPDASNEDAYEVFKRNVKIGFDPTEGIIKMEVIAASPEMSAAFSEALIRYAEERVDNLTQRLREDQMAGAVESFREAEEKRAAAQAAVLQLQQEMGVFDATSDASAVMSQINTFEVQLGEKRLQLEQLLDNARPNQARVEGVRGDIRRLESLIESLRAKLTESGGTAGTGESLAQISGQLAVAQSDLETRTILMQQALQQLESARIEANKQTRYLEMGVHPVAPDRPTYPRAFENTVLAFLVFAGIYLMVSITASILREQVTG
ncbi:capsule biosynthesis protein [Maritimibacter fusiformis]|uniref:Capsule biosynthesis protein n=1 Tax=Maritimibacter fusiformis TaxID=2603819 RepID=A0A5D0RNW6_9RHOB|nr:capsule biosynthesis protein [Maritimibacter fusiformis]TYB83287.1 capsule biosynthesis protein [Maritimibacter fusiformis]